MSGGQRHRMRVSQFRRKMRAGIACSYHQDRPRRNLGWVMVRGRVKLLNLWRERRGEGRNAWVVKWTRCHDDARRLIGDLCRLQHEHLYVLLHTHDSCVDLDW